MRLASCLLLVACHTATPPPEPSPPRSEFGFYLLAMMWSPPACSLTLHGLWPNFTDEQSAGQPRAWPQFCGAFAHCEKAEDAACAPGVPVPADLAPLAPEYVHGTLATHEWSKHGSCTALGAMDYFNAEISAIHMVHPDALHAGDYAPADLQGISASRSRRWCSAATITAR